MTDQETIADLEKKLNDCHIGMGLVGMKAAEQVADMLDAADMLDRWTNGASELENRQLRAGIVARLKANAESLAGFKIPDPSLPKPEARPEGEGLPPHCPTVAYIHPKPEGRYGHFFGLHTHQDGTGDCGTIPSCESEGCHRVEVHSPGAGAWRPMETKAARDVLAERRRQVEKEGWTPEHDDEHARGVLAVAGACYALAGGGKLTESPSWQAQYQLDAQRLWPFDEEWYKPRDPRRDLLRAAALILAEIERLDRAQPPTTGEAG